MITLAGQDLAYAVQLYIEEKFNVDAQWATFTMEDVRGGKTALRALVKVYERKKEGPHASSR